MGDKRGKKDEEEGQKQHSDKVQQKAKSKVPFRAGQPPPGMREIPQG